MCTSSGDSIIQNAMTVDVEDYYQVAAFSKNIARSDWDKMESRVVRNTEHILQIFDDYAVKATFFVLGWVARREPGLVRNIVNQGHEIASHGYSHQLIYTQTPELFKEETIRSKRLLEDISGKVVNGYRAASYSITKKSLWALDILAEAGFKYDSSIFPVHHDNYGIPGSATEPYVINSQNGRKIIEYPLSTYKVFGQMLPVAGGGYFRLYPYWLSRHFYKNINKNKKPFVFYMHPWEIDPNQPRIKASWFSEFRHYNNLEKSETRLARLISEFSFSTMKNILINQGLIRE